MEGRKLFYSPVIKSQSFSEPELGISFPSYQRLEGAGIELFSSLRWVSLIKTSFGSAKIVFLRACLVKQKRESSEYISK